MVIAADYPLLEVFFSILIFFGFVVWLWLVFAVFADVFRNKGTSAWTKIAWILVILLLPYLGVFIYLIAEHDGMTERAIARQEAAGGQTARYANSVATDATGQISRGKALLDEGTISESEFEQIKHNALAA